MQAYVPATLGPIELAPGIERINALCFLFAALVSIGLFTYFSALTPYVLDVHLGVPKSEHGRISGLLQTWQEIALLTTTGIWGVLSDRLGRRILYITSFFLIAVGYTLYAFATTPTELLVWRALIGVGIAGSAAMLTTVLADYPLNSSRGKLTGTAFLLNGVGSVIFFLGLTKLPGVYESFGASPLWAGRYALLTAAGIGVITAIVLFGLKPGLPDHVEKRVPLMQLLKVGIAAARKPRIALCYIGAFAARADMVIITIFMGLWVAQSASAAGLSASESTAGVGMVVGITQASALAWAPVIGWIGDRIDRVSVIAISFLLAAVGYGWFATQEDPTSGAAIPSLILLGCGQTSVALATTLLLGQEAPEQYRGSVFGLQNLCGGFGILAISFGGGILYDRVAPTAPFLAVAIANCVILLLALWLKLFERTAVPNDASR